MGPDGLVNFDSSDASGVLQATGPIWLGRLFYAFGIGERHRADLIPLGDSVVSRVILLNWVSASFGTLSLGFAKASIASLLLAILGPTNWFWHKLYLASVGVGLALLVAVSCAILSLVQCSPPAALWDNTIQVKCIGSNVMADYVIFTSWLRFAPP
ncbi:hypothetical protein N7466_009577 [Penicillium verhagenii]|uniref:uncharacterized protein n=1 Tax=Penicillium verhagenii TaxID=1562060 RepID=UPI0025451C13|nr:uncharacterized protein N7466_009577 [Penicillium verhagenii]KAJ5921251.1 hypothetical protein N7466_009577 [Penicillium verhagenii]